MKLKHKFGLKILLGNRIQYILEPSYLYSDYYCFICNKNVGEMFDSKNYCSGNFGTAFEQENWLNENVPCLNQNERIIKDILE